MKLTAKLFALLFAVAMLLSGCTDSSKGFLYIDYTDGKMHRVLHTVLAKGIYAKLHKSLLKDL